MESEGLFTPSTAAAARERYEALGPAAQTVTREVARAMEFSKEEYQERVSGEVVATARDALFASLLKVHVGTADEFETWCSDHPDYDRHVVGNENVDNVVWHPVPFAGEVVAATFHRERDAAVGTLRRQAFGRVYREYLEAD